MGERCPCCGGSDWWVVNYKDNPEDPRLYLRDCECACGYKWSDKPGEMIHSWRCLVAGDLQTIATLRSDLARLREALGHYTASKWENCHGAWIYCGDMLDGKSGSLHPANYADSALCVEEPDDE